MSDTTDDTSTTTTPTGALTDRERWIALALFAWNEFDWEAGYALDYREGGHTDDRYDDQLDAWLDDIGRAIEERVLATADQDGDDR